MIQACLVQVHRITHEEIETKSRRFLSNEDFNFLDRKVKYSYWFGV